MFEFICIMAFMFLWAGFGIIAAISLLWGILSKRNPGRRKEIIALMLVILATVFPVYYLITTITEIDADIRGPQLHEHSATP